NALENNFRLYYYDRGRHELASALVPSPTLRQWHTLRVVAVGDHIQGSLNGQLLLDHRDARYRSGQVGLWTKADSITAFDDFEVRGVGGGQRHAPAPPGKRNRSPTESRGGLSEAQRAHPIEGPCLAWDAAGQRQQTRRAKPGGFAAAAVQTWSSRLYVAHTANDALDVVDGVRDQYLHSIPGLTGVAGVLVSEEHDLVFTSNRGENTVGIIAGADE